MPHMLPWTLLNVLVWCVGVKALQDLRSQFDPQARTWFLLDWGVRSCLVMELAMLGMGHATGLALVSVLTGIASGILMWLGFRSLQKDMCHGSSSVFSRPGWDRSFQRGLAAGGVLSLIAGWKFPQAADLLVRSLHPLEGGVWVAASAWLGMRLSLSACSSKEAQLFRPSHFSLSFAFAFLHAALAPLTWLTGIRLPPEAGALLGTLFVLTLVWALANLVVRIHGLRALEAQNELHARNDRLFGLEKLVAVGTLAAGAGHDFNNALTAILGVTELALKEPGLPEQTRKDLDVIRSSARAAGVVSAQLLGVARHGAGSGQFASVKEAVEQPLRLLAKEFARHKIQVVERLEDVPTIAGDLRQVTQVCLNLFLNARDAMLPKGGGVLEVALAARDGAVEIAVSDTGTGIPKEFRPKVFQPLQTTKGSKGTGLGLSGSRSVIAAMGGEIAFETEEGRGTTFRIRLPASDAAAEAPPRAAAGGSVLIVDDSEFVRETLKRMVEALGRKAVTAENGEEAVRTLSADADIGLVISDVQMPVMDGLELARRIHAEFGSVRALLMTGSDADGGAPADAPHVLGLLTKPVSLEDIRRHLV